VEGYGRLRSPQMLAPTLSTGDLVICDNLSFHKNAKARPAIEARGAELRFLPASHYTTLVCLWVLPGFSHSGKALV
jgi:hypothetical protein